MKQLMSSSSAFSVRPSTWSGGLIISFGASQSFAGCTSVAFSSIAGAAGAGSGSASFDAVFVAFFFAGIALGSRTVNATVRRPAGAGAGAARQQQWFAVWLRQRRRATRTRANDARRKLRRRGWW